MPVKIHSAVVLGIDAAIVEVEVDAAPGLQAFHIVGLPDAAVQESRERVSSAIRNTGAKPPQRHNLRVVVNLAPADIKKSGPLYDFPIALGFLALSGQTNFNPSEKLFVGELALDGSLRPVFGVLSTTLCARNSGIREIYVPKANAAEAGLVSGIDIYGISNLSEALAHLEGKRRLKPSVRARTVMSYADIPIDFSDIKAQYQAKRALEIAAAGGHHILLSGPPGGGKTMLAKSLPSILPALQEDEAIEITKIYSVAGLLSNEQPWVARRPFRSPHHNASAVALVGGGTCPRPGEISLAHRGVLFLDEFPEFARNVLESIRQPLEDGFVTVARAQRSVRFPAKFTLVAAMNPCPCGNYSDPQRVCPCAPQQIAKYRQRISGPLLDRIDLSLEVPRLSYGELRGNKDEETSAAIRNRVETARRLQESRFRGTSLHTNSDMTVRHLKHFCLLDAATERLLEHAMDAYHLSARVCHHLQKVARTIADLAGSQRVTSEHFAEAIHYRPLEGGGEIT